MMDTKKFNLVFEASILANGMNKNAARSGIYFTTLNIFKELIKHKNISLVLYSSDSRIADLKQFLNENFSDKKFKIIKNNARYCYFLIKQKKQLYRHNKNFLMKFLCQILLCISSPFLKILAKIENVECIRKINKNDAYVSLLYKKPNGVKIKSFIMLYDLIPMILPQYNNISFKKGEWLFELCQSLNHDDYYFAISDYTKQDFLKHFPIIDKNKIFTTHLACNETFQPCSSEAIEKAKSKYNIPQNQKYIFSLCTLEPRKNLIRTVKTFIEFIKKNNIDDLVFVLGGGHWEIFIEKLEQEIANLKDYSDKIIKIGYVDDEDLPALYSGAEWFVYTSTYEGFGLPPLEAMSCGCPVITSNNTSLPEVVGNDGIMIDYDSDEQHIQAYEKYYFDKNCKETMAQKGIERAKHFSWEKCVDKILEVIENEI